VQRSINPQMLHVAACAVHSAMAIAQATQAATPLFTSDNVKQAGTLPRGPA
jgi:hypothetical protein